MQQNLEHGTKSGFYNVLQKGSVPIEGSPFHRTERSRPALGGTARLAAGWLSLRSQRRPPSLWLRNGVGSWHCCCDIVPPLVGDASLPCQGPFQAHSWEGDCTQV